MLTDLILGTAGHIDHGKTSLIRALTGVDTDRLPEEKKRGITIELGFAELVLGDVRMGIVDVPGHERFVRNMLSGATGVDLALLAVAADDSVKPQTREHLEILRLLDLAAGVIVLTKCDLADADWIDLVETEVRELVSDTFLAEAPIVRTSATTGEGLDELRQVLGAAADVVARSERVKRRAGPFRMAIDRTFSVAGHGTVVTGSVQSGQANVGDMLTIEPGGLPVRLRGLQNHDRTAEEVHRGQRAAINLAGIHHGQIDRGHELASPGHLVPSTLLSVRLNVSAGAPRPLKNRTRVRLHIGTAELMSSVVLLSTNELQPGESGYAQLFLSAPAVATWNQPFVIRSQSPVTTIGGGAVLDPSAKKIRRNAAEKIAHVAQLASEDPYQRASAALYFAGLGEWQPEELSRMAGVGDPESVAAALVDRGELVEISVSPTRKLSVHSLVLSELCQQVEKVLRRLHEQYPLQRTIQTARLTQSFDYLKAPAVVRAVLARMAADGRIRSTKTGVALAGCGPQLSKGEQKLIEEIIETIRQAGVSPPGIAELKSQTTKNQASVPQLVTLAEAEGHLVRINDDLFLHAEAFESVKKTLAERMADGQGLTLSQIREMLETSRKFAVPVCEHLDRIGFTRREGDLRVLVSAAETTLNKP